MEPRLGGDAMMWLRAPSSKLEALSPGAKRGGKGPPGRRHGVGGRMQEERGGGS